MLSGGPATISAAICRQVAPATKIMTAAMKPKVSIVPRSGWRKISAAGTPTTASTLATDRHVSGMSTADSTEAITYRLDDDGMFYWALEPGDYSLLGYYWEKDQVRRSGYFGAGFSVPETGGDTYLGSIELGGAKVLILTDGLNEVVHLSGRNLPHVQVRAFGVGVTAAPHPPPILAEMKPGGTR